MVSEYFFNELAAALKRVGAKRYRVKLISSGFGDVLTAANMSAWLCEQLGLEFDGVCEYSDCRNRPYYVDLISRLGVRSVGDDSPVKFVRFASVEKDLLAALHGLGNDVEGGCISLVPKDIVSFFPLMGWPGFCGRFLDNSFHKYFSSVLPSSFERTEEASIRRIGSPKFLFHLRLGDVAPFMMRDAIVVPYEARRGDRARGFAPLDQLSEFPAIANWVSVYDRVRAMVDRVRQHCSQAETFLISDGFGRGVTLLKSGGVRNNLQSWGFSYRDEEIDEAVAKGEALVKSIGCDHYQVGDDSPEDFMAAAQRIVEADVVVSTSRSYAFNILANFRKTGARRQVYYTPMNNGYVQSLSAMNVLVRRLPEFDADDLSCIVSESCP